MFATASLYSFNITDNNYWWSLHLKKPKQPNLHEANAFKAQTRPLNYSIAHLWKCESRTIIIWVAYTKMVVSKTTYL